MKRFFLVLALCAGFAWADDLEDGRAAYQAKNYVTAKAKFLAAAKTGDVRAQNGLGWLYDKGLGVAQDTREAMKWYRLAADQGNVFAQSRLAVAYARGDGVPQNNTESVRWNRMAAEQGFADAQANLGWAYDQGLGIPQDFAEAVKWYRLAAEQGHHIAQSNLGQMYGNGQGVQQDYKEAVKWYTLAAAQGFADAQANLGWVHAQGYSVPVDYREAAKWYRLAAEQGHAAAQANLGWLYDKGLGVAQDYQEAVQWYRRAADLGYALAQYGLGVAYQYGRGVQANPVVAYALYSLSSANDPSASNEATARREGLVPSLSLAEIAAAQALTRELTVAGTVTTVLNNFVASYVSEKKAVKLAAVEQKPVAKADAVVQATPPAPAPAASDDGFPERPAQREGMLSCNTRCVNAACWRTYDDGKKIKFRAQRKYNASTRQWELDSGGC